MTEISRVGGASRRRFWFARRALAVVGAAALVGAGGAGCFTSSTLQASSESSSKSSGSFSDSIGSSSRSSSGGGDDQSAYYRDVRDAAASVAATQDESARLEREIGAIARAHDVLDWERDDGTYREIGRGLASAGVVPERLDALADQLSHGDERRRTLIEEGFRAEQTR
ncbi:putative lipoprotein [Myxococcota bacterium]|nr:putative lipoprotein [Myxococcota bacterium]